MSRLFWRSYRRRNRGTHASYACGQDATEMHPHRSAASFPPGSPQPILVTEEKRPRWVGRTSNPVGAASGPGQVRLLLSSARADNTNTANNIDVCHIVSSGRSLGRQSESRPLLSQIRDEAVSAVTAKEMPADPLWHPCLTIVTKLPRVTQNPHPPLVMAFVLGLSI